VVLKADPHPSPPETSDRPEGEGAERGMLEYFIDLKEVHRIHNRLAFSGRCIAKDTSVSPLSLWERARVRGFSGSTLNST
jgi:hypothetical protein